MAPIEIRLPLRLYSEANVRGAWQGRWKRSREQRRLLAAAARNALTGEWREYLAKGGACCVVLIRIAPRPLDTDNLLAALKAVRDGLADGLGRTDADSRVLWLYDQQRRAPREYGLIVGIKDAAPAPQKDAGY